MGSHAIKFASTLCKRKKNYYSPNPRKIKRLKKKPRKINNFLITCPLRTTLSYYTLNSTHPRRRPSPDVTADEFRATDTSTWLIFPRDVQVDPIASHPLSLSTSCSNSQTPLNGKEESWGERWWVARRKEESGTFSHVLIMFSSI